MKWHIFIGSHIWNKKKLGDDRPAHKTLSLFLYELKDDDTKIRTYYGIKMYEGDEW